jgi:acyl-coenzyme A thioesterase PaaI-like protein
MTAFMELADMMEGALQKYPLRTDFRFGGDAIAISDEIGVSIQSRDGVLRGELAKLQGKAPYLHASLRPASALELEEEGASLLELIKKPVRLRNSFVIPFFSERIIFKKEFQSAGIQRIFEINETSDGESYMVCHHRGANGILACEEMNTLGADRVHPGALLALLDETLGWAGFLEVWQGGVTVNLSAAFVRPVGVLERIIAVGVCAGFKGRHRKKIVCCRGGIFALAGGDVSPLVYASGRWLTDPEYKRKMLRYIIP